MLFLNVLLSLLNDDGNNVRNNISFATARIAVLFLFFLRFSYPFQAEWSFRELTTCSSNHNYKFIQSHRRKDVFKSRRSVQVISPLCFALKPTSLPRDEEPNIERRLSDKDKKKHWREASLAYLAKIVQRKLDELRPRNSRNFHIHNNTEKEKVDSSNIHLNSNSNFTDIAKVMVKGRFLDTTCTKNGENILEELFWTAPNPFLILHEQGILLELNSIDEISILQNAICIMQSLLIMGMQLGVSGGNNSKHLSHLEPIARNNPRNTDWIDLWCSNHVQQLKYERDTTGGMELLAHLLRKRTPQGAFDLLVDLGVWEKHEDLSLLRSGFPTRFTEEEELMAKDSIENNTNDDIDALLGLRQDLRHLKVYTIDSESTSEIDDGISLERRTHSDGSTTDRLWIHIADVDRWAPRHSEIIKIAQRRSTSLYLPTGPIPMFPLSLSSGCMSLRAGHDNCALSLGVELLPDGSVDISSIVLTPSLIRVQYRLSYNEVDEMLEEGVGFNEEWELGAMLFSAKQRKSYRCQNGSTEGIISAQIPSYNAIVEYDDNEEDKISIDIKINNGYNTGVNMTVGAASTSVMLDQYVPVVSQSQLIVTEMMILAGEAIGKWAISYGQVKAAIAEPIPLELPFRSQAAPEFRTRLTETKTLNLLQQKNAGGGYCAAWFLRRFLRAARVSSEPSAHKGMGLDCYVQWTSPIRRYSDLQVHAAIKQRLRYIKVQELIQSGAQIPSSITSTDIGASIEKCRGKVGTILSSINFNEGSGFAHASRVVSRSSHQYWLFEHVRRRVKSQKHGQQQLSFDCTVLGCVDETRNQYAVFIHELGLEHRYLSEKGRLNPGEQLLLQVSSVQPRQGLMTLSLVAAFNNKSNT